MFASIFIFAAAACAAAHWMYQSQPAYVFTMSEAQCRADGDHAARMNGMS